VGATLLLRLGDSGAGLLAEDLSFGKSVGFENVAEFLPQIRMT
jgi:hypothetical protein